MLIIIIYYFFYLKNDKFVKLIFLVFFKVFAYFDLQPEMGWTGSCTNSNINLKLVKNPIIPILYPFH